MPPSDDTPKPGQKFPTPTPGYGDRVFYETLLKQRPDSQMAQEWCLSYGVLSQKKAAKLFAIVSERKKQLRTGGTSAASPARPAKKKAKIIKDEGVDPDIQSSGVEAVGSAVL
eukprot:Nitzschia sp. Nitz4//scaffold358_size24170//23661//24089//NITZ4_008436-RA/size24170-augustus-gene-0.49-mRNA-1//-1//CDS//3329549017//8134//frame0